MNILGIKDLQLGDCSPVSSSQLPPGSTEDVMVEFEDDLTEIEGRLLRESPKLQVVPIVGMGGIGKTTLAARAYDHPVHNEYFDVRAWVVISQDYDARRILLVLLASLKPSKGSPYEDMSTLSLSEHVYKTLKDRRYLIVMDDVWSTETWDDAKWWFPDDGNGSRIILTTRLLDVANYATPSCCSPHHKLHLMNVDNSWNLLKLKVFGQEDCPDEVKEIGKAIAKSCQGLPLAIVLIAGFLSTVSRSQESWKVIAENVHRVLSLNAEQFAHKVLLLSYNHLPQHLRPCFLYMGLFPEDYEVYTWKLFKMWEAEGFLESSGSRSPDEEAVEYLDDLVNRNLVMVVKRKSNGNIKSCSVHDLVRELCIRKAEEDGFLLLLKNRHTPIDLPVSFEKQNRVFLMHSSLECLDNVNISCVHTFIWFQCQGKSEFLLQNARQLKVFDLVKCKQDKTFDNTQLFQLFYLRYLSWDCYLAIDKGISHLRNLQTIIIHRQKPFKSYGPSSAEDLPSEIWRMTQLRHLVSFAFHGLPYPEQETLSPLVNLRTLYEVTNFTCTENIRKRIPNLKKLGVHYIEKSHNFDKDDHVCYDLKDLEHLHQLEKFKLKVSFNFRFRERLNPIFPNALKKLTLSGWRRPWEDMMIVGSLPNLEVLKLRDFAFRGAKWETTAEGFHRLKFLLIDKSDLQHWITESDHFPRLKCLVLYRCWCLTQIPDCIGEIPTLELIKVDETEKVVVSAKCIQKESLDKWGNDALTVQTGCYNMLTGDIK